MSTPVNPPVPGTGAVDSGPKITGSDDVFGFLNISDGEGEKKAPEKAPEKDLGEDSEETDEQELDLDGNEDKEEDEDETPDEGEDEEEEDPLDKAIDEEQEDFSSGPFRALEKKYPKIFKEFPQLRTAIGQHRAYRELFPTVQEAKEAVEKTEFLDFLDTKIATGDLTPILAGLKQGDAQRGSKNLARFAERFLPTLHKIDPGAFRAATGPLLSTILGGMRARAVNSGDKRLLAVAVEASRYIFGKDEPPSFNKADPEVDARARELDQREQKIRDTELYRHVSSVQEKAGSRLLREVSARVDPEKALSDFDREAKVSYVVAQIERELEGNEEYLKIMANHRQRLVRSGYSEEEKARWISTYLARAKSVLGPILRRAGTAGTGSKAKSSSGRDGRKALPSTSGKSTPAFKNGKLPDAAAVRKSGLSVLDILNKTAGE